MPCERGKRARRCELESQVKRLRDLRARKVDGGMRERPSACMLEEAFCGTQDPVRASRSQGSTWPTPPHLAKSSDIRGHRAGVRPSVGLAGPYRDIAWAPYRGIFLIHRSIAYAHRYGGACNSRGVLRGRGSGLCTTNMARSITEARLPREIAQSSAPVSFADSTRAASRIVPPAADLHRLHLPVARDFFSVLSVLWDF